MTAKRISGTEIAARIREEIRGETARLKEARGLTPGLVTILVGDDPASVSYVRGKQRAAQAVGFYSLQDTRPAAMGEAELLSLIARYNRDSRIHGILVQLPLPGHIRETRVLCAIDPGKDVDGFHPVNVGRMLIGAGDLLPCTPAGIQQLLLRSGVETDGAEVVVVGRSNIVGKPIAAILLQKQAGANATVTVCHTGTKDLAFHTRRADILIVAAGRPGAVTAEMVKPGAVVIDVGVHRIGTTREGKAKLCGDVEFAGVSAKAGMITPVPGGVGPMTIAMLLANTLKAAKIQAGIPVG